mgnify:FL=1
MKISKKSLPISFIIPLHNEEDFLMAQINRLNKIIRELRVKKYEIILIENGSKDNTYNLAKRLTLINKNIIVSKISMPHYGLAIKNGLELSHYDLIIQLDLDLIDKNFIKKAIKKLGKYDILVGSKFLSKIDNRSIFRKILSFGLKIIINLLFNYYGTDTHGIKAYRKQKVNTLINSLPLTKHMFDTSIIIEAQNQGLIIKETSVNIKVIRPSRFPSIKRIFEAIFDIMILYKFKVNNSFKIKLFQSKHFFSNLKFPIPFI